MFNDRIDAGKKLAEELSKYKNLKDGIVLGLPRGGVVVASEVAKALHLPLDIIVTRKIGASGNPEYAVGAVSEKEFLVNSRESIDSEYLNAEVKKERIEIKRRYNQYRRGKKPIELQGKVVILVDDGLATGLTMLVALKEIRSKGPRKIVVAVPVSSIDTALKIKKETDELVILQNEPTFFAVGQFYENFSQISDEEVKRLLSSELKY